MKLRHLMLYMAPFAVATATAQGYYAPMKAPSGAASTKIKLPPEVQVEFRLDFPKATDVYWEREYGNTYTASFIDTTVINVTYDSTGYRQYTEFEITPKQLPVAVTKDINARYPGWKIVSARIVSDAKKQARYNALVQRDDMNNSYEVNYDMKHTFICSSPPLPKIAQ